MKLETDVAKKHSEQNEDFIEVWNDELHTTPKNDKVKIQIKFIFIIQPVC